MTLMMQLSEHHVPVLNLIIIENMLSHFLNVFQLRMERESRVELYIGVVP